MRLHTRTTFVGSDHPLPSWHAASDVAARRRADTEFTLGLDEEWEDVPTAQLDAPSYDEPTAGVEPPSPEALSAMPEPVAAKAIEPPPAVTQQPKSRPAAQEPRASSQAPERQAAAAQPPRPSDAPSVERSPPPVAPASPQPAVEPAAASAASIPRDVTTGTLLCRRYVLGRLLGTGGSSLIFQAEDRRRVGAQDFGSRIAIKVLRQEMRKNPHALTRLRREFRQMQRLSHPGIARVFELGNDDDIWFMTMELIEGQTINQWLKASANRAAGLKIIGACCDALHHAHQAGVVHGDLKPSNVIVLANGGVKLVDFGSAAERDASMGVIDKERSFAATPPYASPQVLAGEVADPRDDVFSLACLTYGVLTNGEHPFERKSSAEAQQAQMRPAYARGISPRQFEVIVRALAWDRDQRPANVREFMHALLASDLRRDPAAPGAPADAEEPKPTTAVKPEDIARLRAAVAAAEAHAEQARNAPQAKQEQKKSKDDPLDRFKGYVAGPHALGTEEQRQRHEHGAADATREPRKKKKWSWPWQRSALFSLVLLTGAAIVATRFDSNTEPIRQAEAHVAHPLLPPPPPVTAPSAAAASPSETIAPQVEEKKSPQVAVKPKPTPALAPGEISFTTRTLQVGANQTVAALAVKRLNSTRGRAKVAWTIEGGTARRGVHYDVPDSQLIEFLDGQSVRSLFITLIPEKAADGARHSKTFTVKLQQSNGGPALGEIKQVYVTIVGDVAETVATAGG